MKPIHSSIGEGDIWDRVTYPAMKSAIISSLSSSIDIQENRKVLYNISSDRALHILYVSLLYKYIIFEYRV